MKKKERNKTAKIMNDIFRKLKVNAKVEITKQDKADNLNLIVNNSTSFDISINTFDDIIEKLEINYYKYYPDEEIAKWKRQNAGKSTLSKESEILEQYENISHELSIIEDVTDMLSKCDTIDDWEKLDPNIKKEKLKKCKDIIKTHKIENSVNLIFKSLNIEAYISKSIDSNMIILHPNTDIAYNPSYEFTPTTLIKTVERIKDFAENYYSEKFKNIKDNMEEIRWAMKAVLEIEESQNKSYESKERIIKKYKEIIHKQRIKASRRKFHTLINASKKLGLDNEEILKLAKGAVG